MSNNDGVFPSKNRGCGPRHKYQKTDIPDTVYRGEKHQAITHTDINESCHACYRLPQCMTSTDILMARTRTSDLADKIPILEILNVEEKTLLNVSDKEVVVAV